MPTGQWKQVSRCTAIEIINEKRFYPMFLSDEAHTTYHRFSYFYKDQGQTKKVYFTSWERAEAYLDGYTRRNDLIKCCTCGETVVDFEGQECAECASLEEKEEQEGTTTNEPTPENSPAISVQAGNRDDTPTFRVCVGQDQDQIDREQRPRMNLKQLQRASLARFILSTPRSTRKRANVARCLSLRFERGRRSPAGGMVGMDRQVLSPQASSLPPGAAAGRGSLRHQRDTGSPAPKRRYGSLSPS